MTTLPRRALAAVAVLASLAACGNPQASTTSPSTTTTSSSSAANVAEPSLVQTLGQTPPSAPPPPSSSVAAPPPASAAGKVVVIDPGHNGGNASHPAEINKQVPAGRGQTKPCNTTGTATNAGYTEHEFTWDVSVRVRDALVAKGVKVVMTRSNDTGVGPCVNERADVGNKANAAAVVSIHADGSTSPGAHGFHVAYSSPPLNAAQGEPSAKLAKVLRDGLQAAGFATSTYIGSQGLSPRNDLGGLNLSTRPAVLVECGNMRNAAEAAVLSSAAGRQKYADAITQAILSYLG
ncbi:N-acetylmuramoyl-L-alanine amidase [Actinocrispum sp. NPDC049592]|uniref:N-acetylmuramoyl-L-alanine amidase n=1 Tax=Actinocrispum sp. NPDC049592 TaxID=3154835 RepID=UPI003413DF5C